MSKAIYLVVFIALVTVGLGFLFTTGNNSSAGSSNSSGQASEGNRGQPRELGISENENSEESRNDLQEIPTENANNSSSPNGNKNWYEDLESLTAFRKEFLRQLPIVKEAQRELRLKEGASGVKHLEKNIEAFRKRESLFYKFTLSDFDGLIYDQAYEIANTLYLEVELLVEWEDKKIWGNHKYPSKRLMEEPISYPPEHLCVWAAGSDNVEITETMADAINKLHKQTLIEYALLGGELFDIRPAAVRAMESLRFPKTDMDTLAASPESAPYVPEWIEVVQQRKSLQQAYYRGILAIVQQSQ